MYVYKLITLIEEYGLKGHTLLLRNYGSKTRERIINILLTIPEGNYLVLDFLGIELVDVSFIDESVLVLQKEICRGDFGERRIVLKNLNEIIEENLEAAILLRGEKYDERLLVLLVQNESIKPIGKIEKSLLELLLKIRERESISARELSIEEGIEINNASNKLKKLYNYGLLFRTEIIDTVGRQHIYSPVYL